MKCMPEQCFNLKRSLKFPKNKGLFRVFVKYKLCKVQSKELETKCTLQEHETTELKAKVNWFEEHHLSLQKRYGHKSEATSGQINIFNEAEKEAASNSPEPTAEVAPINAVGASAKKT